MRTLTALLLLLLVFAGCDSPTGPWAALDGCYPLQRVNDAPLPTSLPGDTMQILSGDLSLLPPQPNTEYYGKKVEEYGWSGWGEPVTGGVIVVDWGLVATTDTAGVYRLTSLNIQHYTWGPTRLRLDQNGGTVTTPDYWLSFGARNTCP